ncbi:unnamed protein product [Protopolystoma xenopodis]|uniref:Uncharacterized protein n=1 Tax=Protopolystoma xenopodis TaxID=117903 RepID=A0A3S5CV72_9PLAT|nr:unnamed protein product [Protopolystoma xenopodis]
MVDRFSAQASHRFLPSTLLLPDRWPGPSTQTNSVGPPINQSMYMPFQPIGASSVELVLHLSALGGVVISTGQASQAVVIATRVFVHY